MADDLKEVFDHCGPEGAKVMEQAFGEARPTLSYMVASEKLEAARVDFAHCVSANYVRCRGDIPRLKEFAVETYNKQFAAKHVRGLSS